MDRTTEDHRVFQPEHSHPAVTGYGKSDEMHERTPPTEEQSQMEQFADIFENMDMYREMFEGFTSAFTPDQKEDHT